MSRCRMRPTSSRAPSSTSREATASLPSWRERLSTCRTLRSPEASPCVRPPAAAMMSGVGGRAAPVFASSDLQATLAFYEALGFENRGAPPEEWDYLIIGREGIELHFSAPPGAPSGPGICFVYVDDADAVHDAWQASTTPPARMSSPVDQECGMRTFTLLDPDGNE